MGRWKGRWLLLACCGVLAACGGETGRTGSRVRFDAQRSFGDLREVVALGPRPAGSPAAAAQRDLIRSKLRQAGWAVEDHEFTTPGPSGAAVPMVNLVATRPGASEETILLGAHYDTKRFDRRFVGANDGASGVAVLLELARALADTKQRFTLRMLFFDGEEAFGPSITDSDGLYGSKALAAKMAAEGGLAKVRALLLIDMIGDRDLNIGVDRYSAPNLREIVAEEGKELIDPAQTMFLIDDHIPFRQKGLDQVLALIDFQYGARQSPGPLWHTPEDDLRAVSAESLERVGSLLLRVLARLESESPQAAGASR